MFAHSSELKALMNSNSKAAHTAVGLQLTKEENAETGRQLVLGGACTQHRPPTPQAPDQMKSAPSGVTATSQLKAGVLRGLSGTWEPAATVSTIMCVCVFFSKQDS